MECGKINFPQQDSMTTIPLTNTKRYQSEYSF